MSINLLRDTQYIKKIAQSVNCKVTDEACKLIAFEVEHVLRLVIQNATKYKKHFNREILKLEDVNFAIKDLNILDTIYGYEDNEQIQYKKEMDVWMMKPKIMDVFEALKKEIATLKPDPVPIVRMNWLAVNGCVPKIPENATITSTKEKELAKFSNDSVENRDASLKHILIKEVSDNLLSKELQLYLNSVIETIKNEENSIDMTTVGKPYRTSNTFKKMLNSLRENPGLNNIIPLLTNFLYEQHDIVVINGILKKTNLTKIILAYAFNLNFNLEYHLHIPIKILLTFVTSTKLSINYTNNDIPAELHLRDLAAKALVTLMTRYEDKYHNLRYDIANTLIGIHEKEPSNYHVLFGITRVFFYFDTNIIKDFFLKKLASKTQLASLFEDAFRQQSPLTIQTTQTITQPQLKSTSIKHIMAQYVYSALLEVCTKVMANLQVYSTKAVYESVNLYNFISEIFGEAVLVAPTTKGKISTVNEIIPEDDKQKLNRYAYFNYTI